MAGAIGAAHLRELGDFLRTRRGELVPNDVGLRELDHRRRVSGLRREEVAQLAAISTDYYTRIEQGRLGPTAHVLDALVRALQLDADQADYVASLLDHATQTSVRPGTQSGRPRQPRVRPPVRRLLDQLTETPALVLGPRTDVLAWNSLAAKVYADFDAMDPHELNYVRLIFTDPAMRDLFTDWPSVARSCVAILRREAAANPADPALSALVGELTIADPQFGKWWAARNVARQDFGTKVLDHPVVGELVLDWEIFRYADATDQQLVLNSADAHSVTRQRLRILAS
ncbi:helix-turn-helix transcriptional regulator [Tsukamurella sp. 8F]|uniref:helix-turn-helix domain-containing protein n=1 Tax=unclassified Tsukamurella TaxID=2633480 RepID=UPI0023B9ECF9|nr:MULTISPECIES: helix-turn-helix transcriptional regulator [unclassified Tsukamurella]MDF0532374.1 helix-turn-helix transcriptional regulator [Tsukamurella sp. 8J]MDF0589382.1 helix-turn-helix transcriptional regulator [Tsukamurella sp. 8F]